MDEHVFALNNVSYSYPGAIPAVQGLSLHIHHGDRVAIIGANGSGKSTLLTLLDALIFPDSGTMHFKGQALTQESLSDPVAQRRFRSCVGYVFQNPDVQLFCPTVTEDILFGPLQLGVSRQECTRRFEAIVRQLRIEHLVDRTPHQLSIGEKKKAAIASTLIMEPEVLLLDEPTAGLDPQTNRDIIAALVDAHRAGKTVVFATHDLHIVEEIADVVHVFGPDKNIIRSGKPEEILADSDFLQRNNLIHVHVHRHLHTSHVHPHGHAHSHEESAG